MQQQQMLQQQQLKQQQKVTAHFSYGVTASNTGTKIPTTIGVKPSLPTQLNPAIQNPAYSDPCQSNNAAYKLQYTSSNGQGQQPFGYSSSSSKLPQNTVIHNIPSSSSSPAIGTSELGQGQGGTRAPSDAPIGIRPSRPSSASIKIRTAIDESLKYTSDKVPQNSNPNPIPASILNTKGPSPNPGNLTLLGAQKGVQISGDQDLNGGQIPLQKGQIPMVINSRVQEVEGDEGGGLDAKQDRYEAGNDSNRRALGEEEDTEMDGKQLSATR
jgi:hypothetical protein